MAKKTNTAAAKTKAAAYTHSKEQLLKALKYATYKDLLGALLDDNRMYTLEEIDTLIENFMKGEVK